MPEYVLVKLKADAFDDRHAYLNGRWFVARYEGQSISGYDMGWGLFPGFGGVSESNLEGWAPLPEGAGDA